METGSQFSQPSDESEIFSQETYNHLQKIVDLEFGKYEHDMKLLDPASDPLALANLLPPSQNHEIHLPSLTPPPSSPSTSPHDLGSEDSLSSSATGELPCLTPYPGRHNFRAEIDMTVEKAPYVISTKLQRLYIKRDQIVQFLIKWNGDPNLKVRALLVFTDPNGYKLAVKRCANHRELDKASVIKEHVLCSNNSNAKYEFNPVSQRYSVVVPLEIPQEGTQCCILQYRFMCQSSCPGGINRLKTDIVFTLEDFEGKVVGRDRVSVKICTCPKRDKDKDEDDGQIQHNGKRKMKNNTPPKTKLAVVKRELDEDDSESALLEIKVRGRNAKEKAKKLKTLCENWAQIQEIEEFDNKGRIQSTLDITLS